MILDAYRRQVKLLTQLIPYLFDNDVLAMHGGTALNLFERNMPRLSVDIDLTYIPIQTRKVSLQRIENTLGSIKNQLQRLFPEITILGPNIHREETKLICSTANTQVKIEVNINMRGVVGEPRSLKLCDRAQEQFDIYCEAKVVSKEQLYGGKIVAALDRQHPRDLFDTQYILQHKQYLKVNRKGLMYALLSSNRPIHELLSPNLIDQKEAFENQFQGMAIAPFSYEDYENARKKLIKFVSKCFTQKDKEFLLSFKKSSPNWDIYPFENYPSVKWKLLNIQQLIRSDKKRHEKQLAQLRNVLSHQ
jgi:predicted nucleotidyltransferase component of viral defense system